jgi:hypothetical protein
LILFVFIAIVWAKAGAREKGLGTFSSLINAGLRFW